jgi:hypothetical protein
VPSSAPSITRVAMRFCSRQLLPIFLEPGVILVSVDPVDSRGFSERYATRVRGTDGDGRKGIRRGIPSRQTTGSSPA